MVFVYRNERCLGNFNFFYITIIIYYSNNIDAYIHIYIYIYLLVTFFPLSLCSERSSGNRHELTPKVLIDSVNNIQSHALRQLQALRDLKESLPVEREDDDVRASLDFEKSSSRKEKSVAMKSKKQTKEERKAALFSLLKEARSEVPSTRNAQVSTEQALKKKENTKHLWSGSREQWSSIMKDIDEVYGADNGKPSSFQSKGFMTRVDGNGNVKGVPKKVSVSDVSLGLHNDAINQNMQRIDVGDANRNHVDDEQKKEIDSRTDRQSSLSQKISSANLLQNHHQLGKQSMAMSSAPGISSVQTFSSNGISSPAILSDKKTQSMNSSEVFGRVDHIQGSNVNEKASPRILAPSGSSVTPLSFSQSQSQSQSQSPQPASSLTTFSIPSQNSTEAKDGVKGFDLKHMGGADRGASESGLAKTGSKQSLSIASSGVKGNKTLSESTQPFESGNQPIHPTHAGNINPAKSGDGLVSTDSSQNHTNMFSALSFGPSTGQAVKSDTSATPFQASSVSLLTQPQGSTPAFGFASSKAKSPPSSSISPTTSPTQQQQNFQPSVFGANNHNANTGPPQQPFGQTSSMASSMIRAPPTTTTTATPMGAVGFGQSSSPGISSGFGQPSSFGTALPFTNTSTGTTKNLNLNTATPGSPQTSFSTASLGSGFGQSSQIGMQTGLFAKSSSPSSAFGSSNFGVMSSQQQQSSFHGVAQQNGFGNAFQNAAKSSGGSPAFGGNAFSALAAGSGKTSAFGGGSNSLTISLPSPQPQSGAQWEMRK